MGVPMTRKWRKKMTIRRKIIYYPGCYSVSRGPMCVDQQRDDDTDRAAALKKESKKVGASRRTTKKEAKTEGETEQKSVSHFLLEVLGFSL